MDAYGLVKSIPKSLIYNFKIDSRELDLRVTKNYQTDCPISEKLRKKLICYK